MDTDRLNILLWNLYFSPDTSATAAVAGRMAERFAEDHDVTVLAGRPSYRPKRRYGFRLFRRMDDEGVPGVVVRVGSTAFARERMVGRVLNFITFLVLSTLRAAFLHSDVIVVMSDPPVTVVPAVLVGSWKRIPVVYTVQDLHPESAIAAGVVRQGLFTRAWDFIHTWGMTRANRVVVLGEDMKELVLEKGVRADEVTIVRTGTRVPKSPPKRDKRVSGELRGEYSFVAMHAGNLGHYGAWDTIVEAGRMLKGTGIGLVLVGDGARKEYVEKQSRDCAAITLHSYRPREEVPQVLAAADVHIVSLKPGIEGGAVPSKLYPILAAGRPVVALMKRTADAARIVKRYNCGVVVNPEAPKDLAGALKDLASEPSRLEQMADNAWKVAGKFDQRKELDRLVKVVESVAAENAYGQGA